jgi:hypothetical protein
MINKLSRFASSFAGLLSESTVLDLDGRVEDVRNAMLEALSHYVDTDAAVPKIWARIVRATDIQALWYLRSDLLGVLADICGEPVARESLSHITELFRGAVPDTHMPKVRKLIK